MEKKGIIFSIALLVLGLCASQVHSAIWYVDGSGSSGWLQAFATIQEAVDAASAGDEIWVRMGTYTEYPRIRVDKAVGIYGGFLGNETRKEERDWKNNVTTVDQSGFDVFENAVLDGFVISNGNKEEAGGGAGGGIFSTAPYLTVRNCTFRGNIADWGGAIYMEGGLVTRSTFLNNYGDMGGGGAINAGPATITDCTFTRNGARWGGAISGGDVIKNCTFMGNHALYGGAVSWGDVIENCTFMGNHASRDGGAVETSGAALISNCFFSENSSSNNAYEGGVVSLYISEYNPGSPVMTNCIFSNNQSHDIGGSPTQAIIVVQSDSAGSSAIITNCTFYGNKTLTFGHEGRCATISSDTALYVSNSLFWGNTVENSDTQEISNQEILIHGEGSATVRHCLIEGGYPQCC